MFTLTRIAQFAAGLGGLLWTVKALVITLRDGSFEPLEGFVFVGGLLGITIGAVLFAVAFGRRFRGLTRVAATVGGIVTLVFASGVLMSVGVSIVGGVASGDNLGLEEEGGVLLTGLAWLTFALLAAREPAVTVSRRPTRAMG